MAKFWLLKDSIKMFGFKDGFTFWFKWSFLNPIREFVWLNTGKPYCTYCGWYCKEGCEHKKLTTKKEILKDWEEAKKEMDTVEKGKNGMCVYCGEEKGTETIPNPNFDKLTQWLICKDCKEVIYNQQLYSMGEHIKDEKIISKAINKLDEIAKRTRKPILVVQIRKTKNGYEPSSIEFTGKEE